MLEPPQWWLVLPQVWPCSQSSCVCWSMPRPQLGPGASCQASLERIFITNTGRKSRHRNTPQPAAGRRRLLLGSGHTELLLQGTGDTWGPRGVPEHRPPTGPVPGSPSPLGTGDIPWKTSHLPLDFSCFPNELHRRGSYQTPHLNRTERSSYL